MPPENALADREVLSLLRRAWYQQADVTARMKVRRMLINQNAANLESNLTGTLIPPPFNRTSLAIRSMIGEPAKAAQHYASRIGANRPDIEVIPLTMKSDINVSVARHAGEQERMDAQMWEENGGRVAQRKCGWAMTVGGAGFYLTLPRDAAFGLPDRTYYDDKTDDEIATLIRTGKVSAVTVPHPKTGHLVYAEKGDVWAARRKDKMKMQAGTGLFTLEAYPRDMVIFEKDADGLKWAAIIEEVAGDALREGGALARSAAELKGVPLDDRGLYGLMRDSKGAIIGGISRGNPLNTLGDRTGVFTLIRYFDRIEQRVFVASQGSIDGGCEVYRAPHGCTLMGVPTVPVVEIPFMRTDIEVPGMEYATPLQQVFGYVPQINQLLTLSSNKAAFNGIPRWVVELSDGSQLRGEDGEPKIIEQADVPGLSPSEATAWPGTLKQLVIDESGLLERALEIYFARLDAAMPPPVSQGVAGSSSDTAWGTHQLIQEAQQNLMEAADNHAAGVKQIIQMWHGWERDLDVPIYFFGAPGHRKDKRSIRGLVEFDPRNLTDSIQVTQSLDTPSESTVRIQVGMELWMSGLVTDEEFASEYLREQDARQWVIDRYVQLIKNYIVLGQMPANYMPDPNAPPPLFKVVADGIRGMLHYDLLSTSANYADANARTQAQQALQAPQQPQSGVADAAGVAVPGMGLATDVEAQMGARIPAEMPAMPGVM